MRGFHNIFSLPSFDLLKKKCVCVDVSDCRSKIKVWSLILNLLTQQVAERVFFFFLAIDN